MSDSYMFVIGILKSHLYNIYISKYTEYIPQSYTHSLTQKPKAFGHRYTAKIYLSAGKQKQKETFMQLTDFQF